MPLIKLFACCKMALFHSCCGRSVSVFRNISMFGRACILACNLACILALFAAIFPSCPLAAQENGQLVKVIALARHGVRSPTQSEKTLALWSRKTWPAWPVGRGKLTERGFSLAKAQWQYLRRMLIEKELFGDLQCQPRQDIFIRSDTDERDQATSRAILEAFGGNCGLDYTLSGEKIDPLFHPVKAGLYSFDPVAVATDVQMMTRGGFEHLQEILGGAMNLLNQISGSPAEELCRKYGLSPDCRLAEIPNAVSVSPQGDDIRLTGGLGIASSMAEIFLLEYAEWPGVEAGWGQVNATVLGQILPAHSLIFDVVNRAPAIAWARGVPLLLEIAAALGGTHKDSRVNKAKLAVFVGHDTNIANIGALLGIRWHARGYPPNGIPPGSVMFFELWERGNTKEVRARFFAQKPDVLHAPFISQTGDASGREAALMEFAPSEGVVWAPPVVGQAKFELGAFLALAKKVAAGASFVPPPNFSLVYDEKTMQ